MPADDAFTPAERAYLQQQRLGRIATVGPDGTPHVVPTSYAIRGRDVHITGHNLVSSKKFRDIQRTGRAAFVVDDVPDPSTWQPRGIEIRGAARASSEPPMLVLTPRRIVAWGIDTDPYERNARDVPDDAETAR